LDLEHTDYQPLRGPVWLSGTVLRIIKFT